MSDIKIENDQGSGSTPSPYYRETNSASVDPSNEESLSKWQKNLGISRQELLDAIKLYGTVTRDIRRGLINHKDVA